MSYTKLLWPEELLLEWCWSLNVLHWPSLIHTQQHIQTHRRDCFDLICCFLVDSSSEKTFQRWAAFHKRIWFIRGCLTCGWAYDSQFKLVLLAKQLGCCSTFMNSSAFHSAGPRNRYFIFIQCSNPHSVSWCRKSVNLSWLHSAKGKWDYFISTRQGLIPFSESQNQYDFDQPLFISSRFTLVLSICREEIGIWPALVCVCDFCFYAGPLVKFTLLQGCPPQLIPYSHEFSLHFNSSLRSHAYFHVWLVRMFVTDCFSFL